MDIGQFMCGIGVLVWDQKADEFLLLKRSETKDFGAGLWECVTGRVDQGEGFEDAAHREVKEELGVSIELLEILGTTHFYRGAERPEYELIGIVYLGSIEQRDSIKISQEHSEYRWVTSEEAATLISSTETSESWLARVIERAEVMIANLPPGIFEINREAGGVRDL